MNGKGGERGGKKTRIEGKTGEKEGQEHFGLESIIRRLEAVGEKKNSRDAVHTQRGFFVLYARAREPNAKEIDSLAAKAALFRRGDVLRFRLEEGEVLGRGMR